MVARGQVEDANVCLPQCVATEKNGSDVAGMAPVMRRFPVTGPRPSSSVNE
ncbi:hypothetical protein RKD05_002929 [Microbacterium sp. SLBN-111]